MKQLPGFVRAAPSIFYVAGVLYFLGTVVLLQVQISSMAFPEGMDAGSFNVRGVIRATTLNGWLQATYGGLLLVGIGIVSRLLLELAEKPCNGRVRSDRGSWEDVE